MRSEKLSISLDIMELCLDILLVINKGLVHENGNDIFIYSSIIKEVENKLREARNLVCDEYASQK